MYRFAVIIFAFKFQIFLSIEMTFFTLLFWKYDFGRCHPYLLIQNERWEVGDGEIA